MPQQSPRMMPLRHVLPGTVVLLTTYLLLLLFNVGIFEVEFNFAWGGIGALENYQPNHFNFGIDTRLFLNSPLIEAQLGVRFWVLQSLLFTVSLLLPLLRIAYGLGLVGLFVVIFSLVSEFQPAWLSALAWFNLSVLTLVYVVIFLVAEARERQLIATLFARFVPPTLVRRFNLDQRAFYLDSEPRQLTIMFCDIHQFTTISERMSPSLLAKWLGEYFELVTQIIENNQGTVDKYMGDSVMAIWGAPEVQTDHADHAITAAQEIITELEFLNRRLEVQGLPAIKVGVGLASGVCNVGIMGSQERRSYTVVGDVVNTAQRLEKLTRQYNSLILFNESTANLAKRWRSTELGTEYVRGRKRFVAVFKPNGLARLQPDQANNSKHR